MKLVIGSVVAGVLVAGVAASSAQSLADVARKEEARRQKIAKPSKVYTDDDVQKYAPVTPGAQAAATTVTALDANGKPVGQQAAAEGLPADEAGWRARLQNARDGLDRDKLLLSALEQQARSAARRAGTPEGDEPADDGSTPGGGDQAAEGRDGRVPCDAGQCRRRRPQGRRAPGLGALTRSSGGTDRITTSRPGIDVCVDRAFVVVEGCCAGVHGVVRSWRNPAGRRPRFAAADAAARARGGRSPRPRGRRTSRRPSELLQRHRPALVLTDLKLPRATGSACCGPPRPATRRCPSSC